MVVLHTISFKLSFSFLLAYFTSVNAYKRCLQKEKIVLVIFLALALFPIFYPNQSADDFINIFTKEGLVWILHCSLKTIQHSTRMIELKCRTHTYLTNNSSPF